MAEKEYQYGSDSLQGVPLLGGIQSFANYLSPIRREVITAPETTYVEDMGVKIPVSTTEGVYGESEYAVPQAFQGIYDFAKLLYDDPVDTAKAVGAGLADVPRQQYLGGQAMLQGFDYAYDPETGEEFRYDPTLVPAAMAIGTAASIRQADGLGRFIGMLGGNPTDSSLVQRFGFYQDNPDVYRGNNEYTQSNAAYVERTMPEGSDYLRGPQTAILGRDMSQTYAKGPKQEKPLMLPAELLHRLPGSMHEARSARNPDAKYDRLSETVAEEGFDRGQSESGGVIVGVNHLGQAYIIEGNTRAALAFDQGIPSIKAEVRYYNGGEMVDGPFSPQRMAAYSEFGIETGGDIFGMAGGRRSRPTDPLTVRALGGGQQGIAGLAHGVKSNTSEKTVRVTPYDIEKFKSVSFFPEGAVPQEADIVDISKIESRLAAEEPYNKHGDRMVDIPSHEFVADVGLSNRMKHVLTGQSATSAEIKRPGFSLSTDPSMSARKFTVDSGPTDTKLERVLAVTPDNVMFDKATGQFRKPVMNDVQNLSPAVYLSAAYQPSKAIVKKPQATFYESEVHISEDVAHAFKTRQLTPAENLKVERAYEQNLLAEALANRAGSQFELGFGNLTNIRELNYPDPRTSDLRFQMAREKLDKGFINMAQALNRAQGQDYKSLIDIQNIRPILEKYFGPEMPDVSFISPDPKNFEYTVDFLEEAYGPEGRNFAEAARKYVTLEEQAKNGDMINRLLTSNKGKLAELQANNMGNYEGGAQHFVVGRGSEKKPYFNFMVDDTTKDNIQAYMNHMEGENAPGFDDARMVDITEKYMAALEKDPVAMSMMYKDDKGYLRLRDGVNLSDDGLFPVFRGESVDAAQNRIQRVMQNLQDRAIQDGNAFVFNADLRKYLAAEVHPELFPIFENFIVNYNKSREAWPAAINASPEAQQFNQLIRDRNAAKQNVYDLIGVLASRASQQSRDILRLENEDAIYDSDRSKLGNQGQREKNPRPLVRFGPPLPNQPNVGLSEAYRVFKDNNPNYNEPGSRTADLRYNTNSKLNPSMVRVRDNPAVKFEDGGPVRAGIAKFIQYMQ